MRTIPKNACLVLLAAWAGITASMAQTNPPASATNLPARSTSLTSRTGVSTTTTISNYIGDAPKTNTPSTASLTSRTGVSSTTTITNPPTPVSRVPSRRYSGKILTVDSKTQIITLQGGDKAGIGVTGRTRIVKDKKPAAFADLAAGQSVSGMARRDITGKWLADTLTVGDTRQPTEEEATVIPLAADKAAEATANIHIIAPGGMSQEAYAFGDLPAQPGIVRTNTLGRAISGTLAGADLTRSIRVDGAAVVAWYPNIADMDIICHVTPGKHEVTVVLKDNNSGQTIQNIPITVTLKAGETQNADFR